MRLLVSNRIEAVEIDRKLVIAACSVSLNMTLTDMEQIVINETLCALRDSIEIEEQHYEET